MKRLTACVSLFLAVLLLAMAGMTACGIEKGTPTGEPSSESMGTTNQPTDEPTNQPTNEPTNQPTNEPTDEPTDEPTGLPTDGLEGETKGEAAEFNVIFALATVPPVIGAMESVLNGNHTFAIVERGKTFNGIDGLKYFHNVGFDPTNNKSTGFTQEEFEAMVNQIKALEKDYPGSRYTFYVQDGTALIAAGIAANAGVTKDRFHVYMVEDGTGAYAAVRNSYIKNKNVTATSDEPYEYYESYVATVKAQFDAVMAKTDNQKSDFVYNIAKAFALASLDNFTYYFQDQAKLIGILEEAGDATNKTELLAAVGAEGYAGDSETLHISVKYGKISEGVAKMSAAQKTDYLKLMYGEYYQDTYDTLMRSERADQAAPAEKLVYIGTRVKSYPALATDGRTFGVGGLAADATVPGTYAELDAKYKTSLLFGTESDYTAFLAVLNDPANYDSQISAEALRAAKVACFNVYINYMMNLKLTYALYGEQYDIIMKGHPREVIGEYTEWSQHYDAAYTENGEQKTYRYNQLMDKILLAFHANDSVGKYIGMVPYGTAAENLAYLGANISLTGLPSSTYAGYDTDVDVLSIFCVTNEDILGASSQVAERFEAGNLKYTLPGTDVEKKTAYYNTGNMLRAIAAIYAEDGNEAGAAQYRALFNTWLASLGMADGVLDEQGFIAIP